MALGRSRVKRGLTGVTAASICSVLAVGILAACGASKASRPLAKNRNQDHRSAIARTRRQATHGGARPGGTASLRIARRTYGRSGAPPVTIDVSIPGFRSDHEIPKENTCDGADRPFAVQWSNVPPDTSQIAVFVIDLQPRHGKLFFDFAISGINPRSHGVTAVTGRKALVAQNSLGERGYSICPAKGTHESYIVRVIALAGPLGMPPGVAAPTLYAAAERSALAVGIAGGRYSRS